MQTDRLCSYKLQRGHSPGLRTSRTENVFLGHDYTPVTPISAPSTPQEHRCRWACGHGKAMRPQNDLPS